MPIFGARKFVTKKVPARRTTPDSKSGNLNRKSGGNLEGDLKPATADRLATLKGGNRKVEMNLNLPGTEVSFENGDWTTENDKPMDSSAISLKKTNSILKKQVDQLREENNMWRLKYEVLLNMLTQATAESHLQQREIEKLKHSV